MRPLIALGVAAALACPALAGAATCPDIAAPSIVSPATEAALKCLSSISKNASGFVKTKMSTEGKCLTKGDPAGCPNTKDDAKIQKAVIKAEGKIADACGDDAAQAGLASSYGDTSDESKIASCVLSQHNATAAVMVGLSNGAPSPFATSADRAKCVAALSKAAAKFVSSFLKTVNKCVDGQLKDGNASDLGPVCVGSWSGGVLTPGSDTKTAEKLAKAVTKAEDAITKSCGTVSAATLARIHACEGASSAAEFNDCIVCRNWDGATDLLDQQYNEDATFVENGPLAIQTAVTAASAGDKLLIEPGTYQEVVNISTDGLQLVGCGGASDDRPVLEPPLVGSNPNGIVSANTDDLLFQSLEVYNWDENGILITGADGVTFRDIKGDGNVNSLYAVFPVESNDVLVEGCHVTAVADAGIYVGSSTNIVVRYNRIDNNVAGLEIENSGNAQVYNNLALENTGGILVFKLPGPPLQISENHDIHHNVSVNNNTENFGAPGSTVSLIPTGTGLFIISNDTSDFYANYIADNRSLGITLIDQEAVNGLASPDPPPFDPTSADQTAFDNHIFSNFVSHNGYDPDEDRTAGLGGNYIFVLGDDQGGNHENCYELNGGGLPNPLFLTDNDCD